MDNENNFNVPYIVFESSQANNERTIKRLIIALVITIVLMFATNNMTEKVTLLKRLMVWIVIRCLM